MIEDFKRMSTQLMWNFPYEQRVNSWIWAARERECPVCGQKPYHGCLNMTDVHRFEKGVVSIDDIRITKWPHEHRVDFEKLYRELLKRGYRPEPEARRAARMKLREKQR
jgi:hypothetical protein